MTSPRFTFGSELRALWCVVRALTRESAYERYLKHHAAHHADAPALSPREFYLREQQRKWEGVSRCC